MRIAAETLIDLARLALLHTKNIYSKTAKQTIFLIFNLRFISYNILCDGLLSKLVAKVSKKFKKNQQLSYKTVRFVKKDNSHLSSAATCMRLFTLYVDNKGTVLTESK